MPDNIDPAESAAAAVSVPQTLKLLQRQFGQSIATPFLFGETAGVACQVEKYARGLVGQMIGRGDLTGVDRLAVYNQQYWFRLLTVMQEEYPLLERLLGVREFNRLATCFLTAHPSTKPYLRHLSDPFVKFLQSEDAGAFGSMLNVQAARLESLFIQAFDAAQLPLLSFSSTRDAAELVTRPLKFQPHVGFCRCDWDLVEQRRTVLRDPSIDRVEPNQGVSYWAVYRGPRGNTTHRLHFAEWLLVEMLFLGTPIAEACELTATQLSDTQHDELIAQIQNWFASWAEMGWFAS